MRAADLTGIRRITLNADARDGWIKVELLNPQGYRIHGYTLEEAMRNIAEAAELCLEDESPSSQSVFVGVRDLAAQAAADAGVDHLGHRLAAQEIGIGRNGQ